MDAKELGQQLAYPMSEQDHRDFAETGWGGAGLTKRELFAAMAMQGKVAWSGQESEKWTCEQIAKKCVKMADAILAELAKAGDQ